MLSFSFEPKSSFPAAVAFVAAHAKSTLHPIHKFMLLKIDEKGVVTLQTTNGSYFLSKATRIDTVGNAGAVCVDASKFASIVGSVGSSNGPVKVKFEREENKITGLVTAGRSRFKLMCLEAHEFPLADVCDSKLRLVFQTKQLEAAINRVNRIAPSGDARMMLNSVCMELSDGYCELVASDGLRLAKQQVAFSATGTFEPGHRLLLPKSQVGQLASLLNKAGEQVIMLVDGNRVAVVDPKSGWRLQFPMLDAKYPQWRRVIPTPTPAWTTVEVDRDFFISCLERAQILADKRNNAVLLDLVGVDMTLTTQGADGLEGAAEPISAICVSGQNQVRACFNAGYLLQAVQSLSGRVVRMIIDGSNINAGSMIETDDDPSALQILSQIHQ